ncbi:MAG: hypothetical protein R6V85_20940 [Polyangia bacterium]
MLFLLVPLAARAGGGVRPAPDDMPSDRAALGDAFVEAWSAFRVDARVMAHSGGHPLLLDEWLASAPRFLLRDAIRSTGQTSVVLAAAEALARREVERRDLELLAELERSRRSSPLRFLLLGARIRAGDERAAAEARADLESRIGLVRGRAAAALAAAGRREGMAALRRMIAKGAGRDQLVARALGMLGGSADERRLARAPGAGEDPALAAARGEIAMRRVFPFHHLELCRRDPSGRRLVTSGGLYDSWLAVIGEAVRAGVDDSDGLISFVRELRRRASREAEGEAMQRRLDALVDLWRAVDLRIASTADEPRWPAGFSEALELVRSRGERHLSAQQLADRISAELALCAWTARPLEHRRFAEPQSGLRSLTPGGSRALDADPATSWSSREGGRIAFELDERTSGAELWLANSCSGEKGAVVRAVRIELRGAGRSRVLERELTSPTRYFQRVALDGGPLRRVEIELEELEQGDLACLSELRIMPRDRAAR